METWPRKWDRMVLPFEGDDEVLFTVQRVYLQEEHLLVFLQTTQRPGFVSEEEMAEGHEGVGRALDRRDGTRMAMLAWGLIHPEPGTPGFDPGDDLYYVTSYERHFPPTDSAIVRVRPRSDA